jgi:dipeptidyl aminopeptidase/acylaminoacyl peptidase
VSHQLGTVEMEDQILVTKKLLQKFSFLDSSRVGIYGESYGGYATLKIMSIDTGKFVNLLFSK